ncbi:glycoside hydrolase family 6 protein [Nonomuraea terrae]|uniref:glycoside hydrolase family 6 protein n=1 Tax=Nonomuraea terrae TaxID=2530383 RepID=UPI00379DFE69
MIGCGSARPTGPSTSTDVDVFVDQSRVDRRVHAGNWCNQSGAGMGVRPTASPAAGFDAYVGPLVLRPVPRTPPERLSAHQLTHRGRIHPDPFPQQERPAPQASPARRSVINKTS